MVVCILAELVVVLSLNLCCLLGFMEHRIDCDCIAAVHFFAPQVGAGASTIGSQLLVPFVNLWNCSGFEFAVDIAVLMIFMQCIPCYCWVACAMVGSCARHQSNSVDVGLARFEGP